MQHNTSLTHVHIVSLSTCSTCTLAALLFSCSTEAVRSSAATSLFHKSKTCLSTTNSNIVESMTAIKISEK